MKTSGFLSLPLFFLLLLSCEGDQKERLHSSIADYNYRENNKFATARLHTVMYNMSDPANPAERFKMVHISDAHLSSYSSSNHYESPQNLKEAVRFANQPELLINAMVATGDHISFSKKEKAQKYLNSFYTHLFSGNTIPTFPCHGNHDSNLAPNNWAETILKSELYSIFNKSNHPIQREAGENYYYADVRNPMGGTIRIIALDMLDDPGTIYDFVHEAVFSQKQIDWLCNKALKKDMTDNHSVIVITHFPFESHSSVAKTTTFLVDGKFIHTSHLIPEIIEAFREKKLLKMKYPNQMIANDTIYVDHNFSSHKGDFICYMGGHAHVTAQFDVTNIRNRSASRPPQKMLLCTNMSPSEIGTVFNKVDRRTGTPADNSFCIYAIDTREKNIYITFFGAYLPLGHTTDTYPTVQVISY